MPPTMASTVKASENHIGRDGRLKPKRSCMMTMCPAKKRGTITTPMWKRKKAMVK